MLFLNPYLMAGFEPAFRPPTVLYAATEVLSSGARGRHRLVPDYIPIRLLSGDEAVDKAVPAPRASAADFCRCVQFRPHFREFVGFIIYCS